MRAIHSLGLLFTLTFFQLVDCDIYLHNPRGSNNRLHGRNANRQNANRVFDSQNNDKGGYNVGENSKTPRYHEKYQYHMNYLMSGPPGSGGETYLDIEWTNQHGCGDEDLNCQIVLQYMCQPHMEQEIGSNRIPNRKRNGLTESTSLYQRRNPFINKGQKDRIEWIFSRHSNYALNEPWSWYDKCYKRLRNKGLFTADQNLNGRRETSIHTRQNPQGTRRGYECPEERDYYPYWHPTDWIDIAVLADKLSDCSFYKSESFNVKPKGECMETYPRDRSRFRHDSKYNNAAECTKNGGQWIVFSNYLEKEPKYTNQASCENAGLVWTYAYRSEDVVDNNGKIRKQCVVPLNEPDCRAAPYSRSNHLGNGAGLVPLTYRWKLPYYPSQQKQRCFLRIRYNISTNDPQEAIKNDPVVTFMNKLPLQLAINTAQFGRTFQDRSHMFILNGRKSKVPDNLDIVNVNVRGKRGNIVQVYPAVEYDFAPKRLEVSANEAVHIQWTGANTNPNNNAGEGKAGTDRNNFVEMENASYSFPVPAGSEMLKNAKVIHNFHGGSSEYEKIEKELAGWGVLDNSSPSFAGYVFQFQRGKYFIMCTRNNNFTNRNQKVTATFRDIYDIVFSTCKLTFQLCTKLIAVIAIVAVMCAHIALLDGLRSFKFATKLACERSVECHNMKQMRTENVQSYLAEQKRALPIVEVFDENYTTTTWTNLFDRNRNILAAGNECGKVFLWS